MDLNWELLPSKEQQTEFIRTYLNGLNQIDVSDCWVEKFRKKIDKYQLVSHFFWGFWANLMSKEKPHDPYYGIVFPFIFLC